eukprot:366226-Chlamydomonas_euryale.AAC.13
MSHSRGTDATSPSQVYHRHNTGIPELGPLPETLTPSQAALTPTQAQTTAPAASPDLYGCTESMLARVVRHARQQQLQLVRVDEARRQPQHTERGCCGAHASLQEGRLGGGLQEIASMQG